VINPSFRVWNFGVDHGQSLGRGDGTEIGMTYTKESKRPMEFKRAASRSLAQGVEEVQSLGWSAGTAPARIGEKISAY
jgi:hypothetical protein